MKFVILVLMLTSLTGCATGVSLLAELYDSNDPCQSRNIKPGQTYPSFCGAGSGRSYVTRDYQTNRALVVTK